jgi:hypothetical protein
MVVGASRIVFFRLKNSALQGIGAGICGAFVAIQLGAYANQILMQFPNVLIFYGSLAIVYVMPHIEERYIEYENNRLNELEKRRQEKLARKKAFRP